MKKTTKIIAFPGMIQRANAHIVNYEYDKAVQIFDQMQQLQPLQDEEAAIYAFALSEVKRYEDAKALCETLMAKQTANYWDIVELYIKVSMQLKNYQQVEKFITTLIDDKAVPKDKYAHFQQLHSLNAKIAKQTTIAAKSLDCESFFVKTVSEQMAQLYEWKALAIAKQKALICAIIEHENAHPMVQSLALLLLVEQEVSATVKVHKLGKEIVVNTDDLQLPTQMKQYSDIATYLEEALMQDPTALEMANQLLIKHAILTYPLEWQPFDADDIALGYKQFIEELFGKVQEVDVEVQQYLQQLEEIAMIYDG